jgi:hypothetical protein
MALPKLVPGAQQVQVQDTTFSTDALGRHLCSTWQEATSNGGPPFSAVVIGAGMYGAYWATKLYRHQPGKRVLVLDAGRFLVAEHVQNLGRVGLEVRRRSGRPTTRAPPASWYGGCPGAATSSSPAWPTAAAASRCTGVAGAPG